MKKLLGIGLITLMLVGLTAMYSFAQEKGKRSVGPANFYISLKDKIGITKEQEEKLLKIEENAHKKLEELTPVITKAQQSLSTLTKGEDVDLAKVKELLKNIANLEADMKFTIIEAVTLENKILSKDQRDKASDIAREMSKGQQAPPPAPPAKK